LYSYDDFIEKYVNDIYNKVYENGELRIDEYLNQEKIVQQRIISKILEQYYIDDLILINDSHILLIDNLIRSKKKNTFINLPNNVIAVKTYNRLKIEIVTNNIDQYEIEIEEYTKLPNGHLIEKVGFEDNNDNNICRLLKQEIAFPLYVRTRRYGDRMFLKKINGSKKIKDIFIDSKIPAKSRDCWPIVVDSSGVIIWIPGVKKSKFTKSKKEKCDIILRYQ